MFLFIMFACMYLEKNSWTQFFVPYLMRCKFYAAFFFLLSEIPQSWAVKWTLLILCDNFPVIINQKWKNNYLRHVFINMCYSVTVLQCYSFNIPCWVTHAQINNTPMACVVHLFSKGLLPRAYQCVFVFTPILFIIVRSSLWKTQIWNKLQVNIFICHSAWLSTS